ncbi:site-specific DNA-methyltransferase [Pararhizobium haloflavum]|uniref:site-specific DNA-methyltransferase n=1 Tax=Pararhizobium haloflavum TaxID=2037914 RepID=UPI000C17BF43|nr:site-specific DNA-methyltransferase [Pararhizobium haloflavum]
MPKNAADTAFDGRLVPIADLTPNPRNARTHPEDQIEQIAGAMREFGFTNPILADIDDGGVIIAGHGRRLAAMKLLEAGDPIRLPSGRNLPAGFVPVIDCSNWSEEQRRAYTLADNRLAETSEWDDELLKLELTFLSEAEFDLGLTGFDTKSLDRLLKFGGNAGEADPEETPEAPEAPVSLPGDIWLLGNHRIICGDSTDAETVAALLGGEKPHLMVTDPPYGVEYDAAFRNGILRENGTVVGARAVGKVLNDDRADWREAWALFPGEVAYVWHAGIHAATVSESLNAADFAIRSQIIWAKQQFAIGRGDYHWQHEPCWYAVRKGGKGHYHGGRKQSTLWEIPKPSRSETGHSTQKPVECMKRPIENNSEPGDAVYEPFSGSGTTIIAAEMSGRRCFAIELNPAYVDVAIKRWEAFTGEEATHAETGQTFAEISAERTKEAA